MRNIYAAPAKHRWRHSLRRCLRESSLSSSKLVLARLERGVSKRMGETVGPSTHAPCQEETPEKVVLDAIELAEKELNPASPTALMMLNM